MYDIIGDVKNDEAFKDAIKAQAKITGLEHDVVLLKRQMKRHMAPERVNSASAVAFQTLSLAQVAHQLPKMPQPDAKRSRLLELAGFLTTERRQVLKKSGILDEVLQK